MNKSWYRQYYIENKERICQYQQQYNMTHAENIKEYQKSYFQKNRDRLYVKQRERQGKEHKPPKERKPLPTYKIDILERMLRKKLKHINSITISEKVSKILTQNEETNTTPLRAHPDKYYAKKLLKKYQYSLDQVQPFSEFVLTKEGFTLSFN
jgi:hypothetical protein